jgi:two-component system, chemotaxis family, CheB/CheR fusion protein
MSKPASTGKSENKTTIQQLERALAQERARAEAMRVVAIALANAEEQERRALARDLHDDLGQLLAVVSLKMTLLHKQPVSSVVQDLLADCASVVQLAHQKTRAITAQLNPPMLDQLGLIPALQWLADEMQRVHQMDVVIHDDGQPKPMQPAVRATLFRAIRQWLQSMVQAGYHEAEMSVEVGQGHSLLVTVDGWGHNVEFALLDLDAARNHPAASLVSMREKMGYLGGAMTLIPHPDGGTIALFNVPLQPVELPYQKETP